MKKLLAILFSVLMLCTLMSFITVSAADEPTVELVLESEEVDAGDELAVTVYLQDLEDTAGLIFALVQIDYDHDVFEMITYFDEDEEMWMPPIEVASKYNASSNKYIMFGQIDETGAMKDCLVKYSRPLASSSQVRREAEFFTVFFKVKDDAVSGTYDLTIANNTQLIYHGNINAEFDIVNATITVNGQDPEPDVPACEHPEEKLTSNVIGYPTCEEPGTAKITCECGHSYTEEIPAYHNNNMEYHPFKEALDCANPGNIEHWYCPGCYECFEDAYAQKFINPWYIEITVDCVRPEGIADCATFKCETCGNDNSGYGEHDVLACKGGVCSKCNAEIEGNGCQNLDTPACTDGLCYYCGGFVAGFGHENGAWAPCCDGECSYGCGLLYPATEEHVDEDRDDYCDNCWNHLKHEFENFDPCVGGECTICWAWVDGEHKYFYACDQICTNCHELTRPDAAHSMIHVEAKPADCTNDGNIEYWYCEHCGLHYSDEECTSETNAHAVKLPASCKYNAIHMDAVPASCHYNGNCEYWYCAYCDVYYLDEECTITTNLKNVIIPAEKTTADYVPAKDATCTETGNVEHWYCAKCEQYWLDEALTQLTNKVAVTTEKNPDNHTGELKYTNNGNTHSAIYSCCNASYVNGAEHDFNNDDHTCVCGAVEHIHEWVLQEYKWNWAPTPEDVYCTAIANCECGETFSVDATMSFEKTDDAWCYMPPRYDWIATFDVEWAESQTNYSRLGNELDPNRHGGTQVQKLDDKFHQEFCYYCQTYLGEPVAHDKATVNFAGNCTSPAIYTCSCNYEYRGEINSDNHAAGDTIRYKDITDKQHTAYHPCCEQDIETVDHTFNNSTHKCFCGAVEKFTLTISDFNDNFIERKVPYGTNILEYANSLVNSGVLNIAALYENSFEDGYAIFGKRVFNTWMYLDEDYFEYDVPAEMTVEQDITVFAASTFTGWITYDGENWAYEVNSTLLEGWYQINESDYTVNGTGSAWYYFDENGYRVSGLTRVPYPTEPINGVTYGPNAEDVAYATNKGVEFIDADEAWFVFDANGKFQSTKTGIEDGKYVENGMIAWHPGFVIVGEELYYFVGDTENGGNKLAQGIVYVTRGTGENTCKPGYVIFKNGQVDTTNAVAIEVVTNSKGETNSFYFENGICVPGKGLVKLANGEYIYVRSAGQLVIDAQYYITANELGVVSTLYTFDENGYMVTPKYTNVNGIVDGYYYENGKITYAGLIEINGAIYYINSKGQVVTGEYYVTKISAKLADTYSAGDKLIFGEDGKMEAIKNGIVEEGGKYYFYENNHIKYGAGVVKLDDGAYIYVKSNGELATGEYWPTKTNGLLEIGKYNWGTDGKYYAD